VFISKCENSRIRIPAPTLEKSVRPANEAQAMIALHDTAKVNSQAGTASLSRSFLCLRETTSRDDQSELLFETNNIPKRFRASLTDLARSSGGTTNQEKTTCSLRRLSAVCVLAELLVDAMAAFLVVLTALYCCRQIIIHHPPPSHVVVTKTAPTRNEADQSKTILLINRAWDKLQVSRHDNLSAVEEQRNMWQSTS
jgi:hypothetical protein